MKDQGEHLRSEQLYQGEGSETEDGRFVGPSVFTLTPREELPTMSMKLKAEIRNTFTRSATRQLRLARKVPAVVYGKKTAPLPLALDQKEVLKALQHPNELIELDIPGRMLERVILHSVQRDPIDQTVQAVDFHQVDLLERVRMHVHIMPLPDPEGKSFPYQMFLHELHIDCLPGQIPASIELDLSPVRQGKAILVRDLPVPEGVHVMTHQDEVVAAPFFPAGESSAAAG